MAVIFECPHCGSERTVAPYVFGRRVRCPDCDQLVEVPLINSAHREASDRPLPPPMPAAAVIPQLAPLDEIDLGDPPVVRTVAAAAPEEPEPEVEAASAFRKPRRQIEAEMDMTPMVDVTFLLLIFFMVTAAFGVQKAKETAKQEPQDGAQARSFQMLEDDPNVITLHVDEYGAYRVVTVDWDRQAISPTELMRHLQDARRGSASGHVPTRMLLKAHGSATHGRVIIAHDAANVVGLEDVQVLKVEEDE